MPHSRKGPLFAIVAILFVVLIAAVLNDVKNRKAVRFREESTITNATLYYPYYKTATGTINVDASEAWVADALVQKLKDKKVHISSMHVGTDSILVHH